MVNTGGVTKDPVTFELNGTFDYQPDKIQVRVQKDGNWIELEARKGKVASKICVDNSFYWCDEKVNVNTVYPNFSRYVSDPTIDKWW